MPKSLIMFFENERIVTPPYDIPTNTRITYLVNTYNNVKRIIELSEKALSSKLTDEEAKETKQLFKDPNVLLLIDAAEKFARQREWVCPQFYGGLTGGITQIDFGTTVETTPQTMYSLVLLGALIGGFDIDVSTPDIVKTLLKFKEEDAKSDYTTVVEPQTLWKTND